VGAVGTHRVWPWRAKKIRQDLPEISPGECFNHPFPRWAMAAFLKKVKDKEWLEV
jgi:hypothetical protein